MPQTHAAHQPVPGEPTLREFKEQYGDISGRLSGWPGDWMLFLSPPRGKYLMRRVSPDSPDTLTALVARLPERRREDGRRVVRGLTEQYQVWAVNAPSSPPPEHAASPSSCGATQATASCSEGAASPSASTSINLMRNEDPGSCCSNKMRPTDVTDMPSSSLSSRRAASRRLSHEKSVAVSQPYCS